MPVIPGIRKVQAEQLDMASPNSEAFTTGGASDLVPGDKLVISDISDGDKSKVATVQQILDLVDVNTLGAAVYQGTWNAATDTPSLPAATLTNKGHYYVVSTGGTQFTITFAVGDWIISNGTAWQKVDNTDAITSVNGYTSGAITLTKTDVGLGNADNTSDVNKPISSATQTALNAKENTSNKGIAGGYASLDGSGKVPNSQIPALAITDTYIVANQAAMLALSLAETGDVAVRQDLNKSFILSGTYSTLADWKELLTPTDTVLSVNGQNGVVYLAAADVGAQPVNSDLTTIAGLSTSNNDFLQRKAGAWINRTPTQATADLPVFVGGGAGAKGLVPTSTAQNITDKAVLTASGAWGYPGKVISSIKVWIPNVSIAAAPIIPFDNTTPLVSEGTEIWSTSYAAKSTSNYINISFSTFVASESANTRVVLCVFADSTFLGLSCGSIVTADDCTVLNVSISVLIPTTSSRVYSARVGPNIAANISVGRGPGYGFSWLGFSKSILQEITP